MNTTNPDSAVKTLPIYLSIAAISLVQALQLSVSPVLQGVQTHYPAVAVEWVQMLITAPALLSMVIALLSGRLVRYVSLKRLVLFASALAAVVGLLPLASDSFWLLFVCRVLYGVALGITTTMNVAVVAAFFKGEARVRAMGVQSASIGASMVLVTAAAGYLGELGFRYSFLVNAAGILSFVLLLVFLPETGKQEGGGSAHGRQRVLNRKVLAIDLMAVLEMLFLITFSTNIAMHLRGALAGDSSASGLLNAFFSGSQIVIGLLLGRLVHLSRKMTMPVAMLCFAAGAEMLIRFPEHLLPLAIGSTLCGFSQGIFVPTASTQIANAVEPEATASASATLTCAMNLGQLVSPTVMNYIAVAVLGGVTTTNVYRVAVAGMLFSAAVSALWIYCTARAEP